MLSSNFKLNASMITTNDDAVDVPLVHFRYWVALSLAIHGGLETGGGRVELMRIRHGYPLRPHKIQIAT
jgi:hypothetical protein